MRRQVESCLDSLKNGPYFASAFDASISGRAPPLNPKPKLLRSVELPVDPHVENKHRLACECKDSQPGIHSAIIGHDYGGAAKLYCAVLLAENTWYLHTLRVVSELRWELKELGPVLQRIGENLGHLALDVSMHVPIREHFSRFALFIY